MRDIILETRVNEALKEWEEHCKKPRVKASSIMQDRTRCGAYRKLVDYGATNEGLASIHMGLKQRGYGAELSSVVPFLAAEIVPDLDIPGKSVKDPKSVYDHAIKSMKEERRKLAIPEVEEALKGVERYSGIQRANAREFSMLVQGYRDALYSARGILTNAEKKEYSQRLRVAAKKVASYDIG